MKKFFVTVGIAAMAFAFTACGGGNATNSATVPIFAADDEPLSGNLTVSTFDTVMLRPFLESAAELFTEMHPDVTITVDSFSAPPEIQTIENEDGTTMQVMRTSEGPQERRDYVNQISTDLMGGRGPDILAMDMLPFYRYARMGQLVDLRPFMEHDPNFDINDYRANIFDLLTTDTGLFKFPINIDFQYITFDSTLFTPAQQNALMAGGAFTIQELLELGSPAFHAANEEHNMFSMADFVMFRHLFHLYQNHFINFETRTANFTDGVFVDMLNMIQNMDDQGYLQDGTFGNVRIGGMEVVEMDRFLYKFNPSFLLFQEFNRDDPDRLGFFMGQGVTDDDMVAGLLGNSLGDVPFALGERGGGTAFGINSNSQNQALAWEFIKFLSSDALIDLAGGVMGIPLHIGAFEESAWRNASNHMFTPRRLIEDSGAPIEYLELNATQLARKQAYIETVDGFINSFTTFRITDALIEEMIFSEIGEFFNGEISAEDLARNLQSRITLVLNE
ncbi:MAG: extracellular solute-binding protein [Defluviitaleaceae bacterium]|nr:extracellular solute-binding protein [Defluviitaleaceae bacterium]